VYPPLKGGDTVVGTDGIFQRHTVRAPRKSVKLGIKKVEPGKVAVRIPADALEGLHELHLQIEYIGDVGSAYLDGKLIHANFWNGKTWELGVRPFAPRILETELMLILTPLRKTAGAKVEYTSMAAMQVVGQEEQMEIHSIKVLPEYRVVVKV
jgi:hypothetical protein